MEVGSTDDALLERQTMHKVIWRLLPFLMICYLMAFIDRGNVGMASLQMNHDLGMSAKAFGFGASLFSFRISSAKCRAISHSKSTAHDAGSRGS